MEWSPQHAMKAYLHTLHLCKLHNSKDQDCTTHGAAAAATTTTTTPTRVLIEPKCMELISALAAGKQARLMVEVTTQGVTPLTIALAVAAKHTGGRLICILVDHHQYHDIKEILIGSDLEHVTEFVLVQDPCEAIAQYKNIDFAVIDCKFEDHVKLLRIMNVNPRGCMVVVNNLGHHRRSQGAASFAEIVKKKIGAVESVTLPIGEGMELTRIGFRSTAGTTTSSGSRAQSKRSSRRYKRFHVTFEN